MKERELLKEEARAAYELYERIQGSVPEKVIREKNIQKLFSNMRAKNIG